MFESLFYMYERKNLWINELSMYKRKSMKGLDVSKIKKYKVAICSIKLNYSIVRFFLRGDTLSL